MSSQILTALGLENNPFPAGACSVHYFHTAATKRILDEFLYALTSRKGFLVLIGEVGLGKTSLLLQLLGVLGRKNLSTAWIFNTVLKKEEILQAVARDFGLDVPPDSNISTTIDVLHQFFLENHRAEKNCAIIIDEAHNLDLPTLEVLRMLSNLELEGNKLVQILLVGQPELKARLWQPELRQLRSRINIFEELPNLTREETGGYVNFKFKSSGSQLLLDGKALDMVYTAALGNLRMINLIMEKALYGMVALGERELTGKVIKESLKDIAPCQVEIAERMQRHNMRRTLWRTAAAVSTALILAAAALLIYSSRTNQSPLELAAGFEIGMSKQAAATGTPALKTAPGSASAADHAPTAPPARQHETPSPDTAPADTAPDGTTAAAPAADTARPATAEQAAAAPKARSALRAPISEFLTPLGLGELTDALVIAAGSGRFGAVDEAMPQGWLRASLDKLPPGHDTVYKALAWHERTGIGPNYLAFWQPKLVINEYYPDYRGKEIRTLQKYLKKFGHYNRAIDGSVGSGTWRALHAFQMEHGLDATGVPDPRTRLWLEALAAQ